MTGVRPASKDRSALLECQKLADRGRLIRSTVWRCRLGGQGRGELCLRHDFCPVVLGSFFGNTWACGPVPQPTPGVTKGNACSSIGKVSWCLEAKEEAKNQPIPRRLDKAFAGWVLRSAKRIRRCGARLAGLLRSCCLAHCAGVILQRAPAFGPAAPSLHAPPWERMPQYRRGLPTPLSGRERRKSPNSTLDLTTNTYRLWPGQSPNTARVQSRVQGVS